jgi:hypothetical protein
MAATIYEPLSTAHLKSCTVDFDSRPDKKAVNLVQYDQTIPVLCVLLKKGGTEYKVPSDADVNIRMDKRDGYHVYNPALGVNAERTIAYFAVTPQMSTGWGDYYPIVEITVGGGVAGSAPIWLHFDRNPLPENAIISSDEYKTILLKDVTAVKADTEQIKAQTEAVRDQAKGFADNAKNSADKAQTLVDGMPSDYSQAMKDIGTLKNQMQRAYPDDSTIGENTWSSKNIVDMLCPEIKESGNPVLCYPVAGYPLGVKASWEPVQEGSGTPSPENIRPIKGRDSVTVERCGENLLNPKENAHVTYTPYGLTITYIGDNKVHLKGTYNLEGGGGIFAILDTQQKLLAGRNLKITGFTIEGTKQTYRLYGLRTKDETAIAMNAEFVEGDVIDMTVAIVVSKDTPTTYTPYIGQTSILTLPETVYGGEVDAVTGDGQETWKILTLDGTERWMDNGSVPSTKQQQWALYGILEPYSAVLGISSHFDNKKKFNEYPFNFVRISSTSVVLHVASDGPFATVNDLKSYLAAQKAAGTPVQIAYKLSEPVPFTATGAQPIPALAGTNTVLTDADSATVTGRADPIKRIEDLEAAVASIN